MGREIIRRKVYEKEPEETPAEKKPKWDDDGASDEKLVPSTWAVTWRERIRAVLVAGADGAVSTNDLEARQLMKFLWAEVVAHARTQEGGARALQLFTSDDNDNGDHWAFIPVGDLLLIVAEGIAGITAEGFMADEGEHKDRFTCAEAMSGRHLVVLEENKKKEAEEKA